VSPLSGQNVIQVSGGGQALENAAQGAPAGSVFVVQPGRYSSFPWMVPDATIVAPQGATLVGYFIVGANLAMANVNVIGGFRSTAYGTYPNPGRISASADVVLNNCKADGLSARYCSVFASNCFFGSDGTTVTFYGSEGVLSDTTVLGGIFFSYYGPFSFAENAMLVQDSTVRLERVSISATSYGGSGISGAGSGLIVNGASTVTVAGSQLSGGPAGSGYSAGLALVVSGSSAVTLSNTVTSTPTSGPFTVAPLATAEWTAPGLALGNTVTAVFRDAPATPAAVLLAADFALFTTPVFAEPLFVLGTPSWAPLSIGVTNAQGDYTQSLAIPNIAGLQYQRIWLTGVFLGALPFRSSAPLGGTIQ